MAEVKTSIKNLELLNVSEVWKSFSETLEKEREEIGASNLELYSSLSDPGEKTYDEKHKAAIQRSALFRLKEFANTIPQEYAEAKDEILKRADKEIQSLDKYLKFHYPSAENFYLEKVYTESGIKTVGASVLQSLQKFAKETADSLRENKEGGEYPKESGSDPTASDDPYEG